MKKVYFLYILALLLACTSSFAQYTTLLSFAGATNGSTPPGSLFSDGTFLYGMTQLGGANDSGTVFKIMPDGSGYVKLLDFAGAANGSSPYGSLVSDGTFLYGMTHLGGANHMGVLFKIMPDGSGYQKLLDFAGVTNGSFPFGSLLYDGTFLYGMTRQGGTNNYGTVFKIKPDGSSYVKLFDFTGITNGREPFGSLISDGTFLYGMTLAGGANLYGALFKIKPDGTGFAKLVDFDPNIKGAYPYGTLVSDGTYLYGITGLGGPNGGGTIFKVMTNGSGFIKLLDMTSAVHGSQSHSSLIYDGTFLYGMAWKGGTHNQGTLFEIKPDGSNFIKLLDFDSTITGSYPWNTLTSDGTSLYGMTLYGGTNNLGVIFKYGLTIGIDELSSALDGLCIYPNPATSEVEISFSEKSRVNARLSNALGDVLEQFPINATSLKFDMSDKPKGIYFIIITDEKNNSVTKKVVKI